MTQMEKRTQEERHGGYEYRESSRRRGLGDRSGEKGARRGERRQMGKKESGGDKGVRREELGIGVRRRAQGGGGLRDRSGEKGHRRRQMGGKGDNTPPPFQPVSGGVMRTN